jgi:hypothetical protein
VGGLATQHPQLAAAAALMNERHRQAKQAQKQCSDLYLLLSLHRWGEASQAGRYLHGRLLTAARNSLEAATARMKYRLGALCGAMGAGSRTWSRRLCMR